MFDYASMKKIGRIGRYYLWADSKDDTLLFCHSEFRSGSVGVNRRSLEEFYKRTDHKGEKYVHVENPNSKKKHSDAMPLADFLVIEREWINGAEDGPYCLVNPADIREMVFPEPRFWPTPPEPSGEIVRSFRKELNTLLDNAAGYGSQKTYAEDDFKKNIGRRPNPAVLYIIFSNNGPKGIGFYCGEVE